MENKEMAVITASTVREVVNTVNKYNINHEDIVSLIKDNGQFILIYYRTN